VQVGLKFAVASTRKAPLTFNQTVLCAIVPSTPALIPIGYTIWPATPSFSHSGDDTEKRGRSRLAAIRGYGLTLRRAATLRRNSTPRRRSDEAGRHGNEAADEPFLARAASPHVAAFSFTQHTLISPLHLPSQVRLQVADCCCAEGDADSPLSQRILL
jgi:hypothetical protein